MTATADARRPGRPGVARAALQGFLAEALVFPVGLVTAAYLTRSLGPDQYGRIGLVYAALAPVVWVASTTFAGRVAVKLLTDASDWRPTAAALFRANLGLGTIAALLLAGVTPAIAPALHDPGLAPYLWLGALEIVLLPVTRLHRDALVARGLYSLPAVATLVYHGARLTLVFALVAAGWAIQGVIAANLIARVLELIVCRARISVPIRGADSHLLASARQLLGAVFLYAVCIQLFNRSDLLLLGALGESALENGYYTAAQNVTQAPGLLALVVAPLLIAAVRRAEGTGDLSEANRLREDSVRLSACVWSLALPVAAGATHLAILLFGAAFEPAGAPLGWLGIGAGAGFVLAIHSAHAVARGRYYQPLMAALPMLLVGLALELAWIPQSGALGAARASTAAAILGALIAQGFEGSRSLASRAFELLRAAFAGGIGFAVTRLAGLVGVPSPLEIVLGCLTTGIALIAVGLVSKGEMKRVASELMGKPFATAGTP